LQKFYIKIENKNEKIKFKLKEKEKEKPWFPPWHCFFGVNFCDVAKTSDHHPKEDLAKFSCKLKYDSKNF
jgi:hypothetical protein